MIQKHERVPDSPLAGVTRDPFPDAEKVHFEGSRPDLRVPMRKVTVGPTRLAPGRDGALREIPNPPVFLYDTSGPYTDPSVEIDLRRGLAPLRERWIVERGDTVEVDGLGSAYARDRAARPDVAALRFGHLRRPRRAAPGRNVSQ